MFENVEKYGLQLHQAQHLLQAEVLQGGGDESGDLGTESPHTFRHEIVANTEELLLQFSGEFLQFIVVV